MTDMKGEWNDSKGKSKVTSLQYRVVSVKPVGMLGEAAHALSFSNFLYVTITFRILEALEGLLSHQLVGPWFYIDFNLSKACTLIFTEFYIKPSFQSLGFRFFHNSVKLF